MLELACDVLGEFLSGNIVELYVPGICCLVVGCPASAAKPESSLTSLASCQVSARERTKIY